MSCVNDILKTLETAAPTEYAADFDNVGHLVGRGDSVVRRALVALDITEPIISEAISDGATLIVSHHPIIFEAKKSVTDRDVSGRLILKLIENGVSAICMHTNMDAAEGGVNDILADALALSDIQPLDDTGIGRYGYVRETCLSDFLAEVSRVLGTNVLRYCDGKRSVHKVAVGGGSCGGYIEAVAELGCDTFVTADVKHDRFLTAQALGLNLIDAGHFATENQVCRHMCKLIRDAHSDVDVKIAEANHDNVFGFTL